MLQLEIKRSFHNRTALYILLVNLICFGLGVILPVGLDHIQVMTAADFSFSVYTVYTQFGMMIFGFMIAHMLSQDYTNHYIYFYNQFGITLPRNIWNKFIVFFSENILCMGVLLLISYFYFHNSKLLLATFGLIAATIISYFLVVCMIVLFNRNVLIIVGISLLVWLTSIIMVTFGGIGKYFNVFDASNINYQYVNYFVVGKIDALPMEFYQNIIIEFAILISALIFCIFIKSKEWKREL